MNLLLKHLDVNLGHCNIFSSYNMPKPVRLQRRTVLHYELDFFLESEGGVEVDGVYLPFAKSEVNFRKPGQIVQGWDAITATACTFLLTLSKLQRFHRWKNQCQNAPRRTFCMMS